MNIDQFSRNYFDTDNTALAFSLRSAGVPWKDPANPCWNVYTPETLKRLGVRTVQEAVELGKPGKVTYFLDRPDNLKSLLDAWDKQGVESAKIEQGLPGEGFLNIDPVDMVRILAHCLKGYAKFKSIWREVPPKLSVKNPGSVRKSTRADGSTVVKLPGRRIVSANASEATIKRLGI